MNIKESKKPTERQLEIYRFIFEHMVEHSYPPTIREIGSRFQIKSPNGVRVHLLALIKKGFVRHDKNIARGVVPVVSLEGPNSIVQVTMCIQCPMCGAKKQPCQTSA